MWMNAPMGGVKKDVKTHQGPINVTVLQVTHRRTDGANVKVSV